MKYWMAVSLAAFAVGCSNQKTTRPAAPAHEPVSTTTVTTTSAALSTSTWRSTTEPDTGDTQLARRIRHHLRADRALDTVRLDAVHIHSADGGHVTIDGYVPTLADSVEIERIVRSMDGVVAVRNELRLDGDLR